MFAALHLPDLPVTAALRAFPAKRGHPCAVLEGGLDPHALREKTKLPLLSVNEAATRTGIAPGWPLNRALVRCPDLHVLAPDPAAEAHLLRALIAAAERITPDLEIAGSATLLLDLSCTPPRLAHRLADLELDDAAPQTTRAPTPDLARLAVHHPACHGRTLTVREITALPLGLLAFLPGGAGFLPLLHDWGLVTLGDFTRLPRQELTSRLGAQAGTWHDILHGKTCRLLRLHRPPETLAQSMDFDDAIVSTEPLGFAFKRLCHALAARLEARHIAVRTLRPSFHFETGPPLHREIRLPEPRAEAAALLRPLLVLLDSLTPPGGILTITLDAETTAPAAAQADWLKRQLPHPGRWSDTLARLEALLGPGKVGIPAPPASHRPDDFRLLPADSAGQPGPVPLASPPPASPLPLRRLRPPACITVATDAHPQRPRPLALLTGPWPGPIRETRGPFPLSGHWWDERDAWQRIGWDVLTSGDALLRLAYLPPDRWLIEGLYQSAP